MSWITFWSGNQAAVMIREEYIWLFSNCSTEIFVKCFYRSALQQYNFHLEMECCQHKDFFCISYILRNAGSGLSRAKRGVSSTSLFSSHSYCDKINWVSLMELECLLPCPLGQSYHFSIAVVRGFFRPLILTRTKKSNNRQKTSPYCFLIDRTAWKVCVFSMENSRVFIGNENVFWLEA